MSRVLFSCEPKAIHARVDRGERCNLEIPRLEICRGETLGLVGESGGGKTTIGRMITWLERPTAGRILFKGEDVLALRGERRQAVRREIQAVFQDPFSSLNPRMRVGQILGEPLRVYRLEASRGAARDRVAQLLGDVGLAHHMAEQFPHELSGGQRQRVGIARALAMKPRFMVCDEPVSASTYRSRGRSSGCSSGCRKSTTSPICSSRTTFRSCVTSPTVSP